MSASSGTSSSLARAVPCSWVIAVCALFSAALAGCGESRAETGAVDLSVGTGEDAYQPVAKGSTIPLMKGPQGGFHLWIALRCDGCKDLAVVEFGARDGASGELLSYPGLQQRVAFPIGGGVDDVSGLVTHVTSTDPDDYVGRSAVLWASLRADPEEPAFAEASADVAIGDVEVWNP